MIVATIPRGPKFLPLYWAIVFYSEIVPALLLISSPTSLTLQFHKIVPTLALVPLTLTPACKKTSMQYRQVLPYNYCKIRLFLMSLDQMPSSSYADKAVLYFGL